MGLSFCRNLRFRESITRCTWALQNVLGRLGFGGFGFRGWGFRASSVAVVVSVCFVFFCFGSVRLLICSRMFLWKVGMVGCGLRAYIIIRCHSFVVGLLGHLVLRMQEKLAASGYVRFLLGSGLERGTEFPGFILRLIGISRVYIHACMAFRA